MPTRVAVDDDEQQIQDLIKEMRRLRSRLATTAVTGTHDEFTAAATPATTYTLTYIPLTGTCLMALNGHVQREGTDYTCDYTTGIVTVSVTQAASDKITFRYLVTDWLVARSLAADPGDPPAFKASTTADPGSTSFVSSLAISSPACAVGDLLFLCADTRNRAPSSTPTGWTLLTSVNGTTTTGGVALWYSIYTKTATSTDAAGTTYTVTCATSDNMTLACLAYQPATVDVWAEAHTTTANGTGVLSWATPTITTTAPNRTIVEMWACAAGSSSINALGAPGTPTTSRAEVHMHAGTTNFSRQLVVDEPQLSAGTTTARTATDPNGGAFVAVAIAIHA